MPVNSEVVGSGFGWCAQSAANEQTRSQGSQQRWRPRIPPCPRLARPIPEVVANASAIMIESENTITSTAGRMLPRLLGRSVLTGTS